MNEAVVSRVATAIALLLPALSVLWVHDVPTEIGDDLAKSLKASRQWAMGQSQTPHTLSLISPRDLAGMRRERGVSDFPLLAGFPFSLTHALGLPLGKGVRALTALCLALGTLGWVFAARGVGLGVGPQIFVALVAPSRLLSSLTYAITDPAAYALSSWAVVLFLRAAPARPPKFSLLVLSSLTIGALAWLKTSAFIALSILVLPLTLHAKTSSKRALVLSSYLFLPLLHEICRNRLFGLLAGFYKQTSRANLGPLAGLPSALVAIPKSLVLFPIPLVAPLMIISIIFLCRTSSKRNTNLISLLLLFFAPPMIYWAMGIFSSGIPFVTAIAQRYSTAYRMSGVLVLFLTMTRLRHLSVGLLFLIATSSGWETYQFASRVSRSGEDRSIESLGGARNTTTNLSRIKEDLRQTDRIVLILADGNSTTSLEFANDLTWEREAFHASKPVRALFLYSPAILSEAERNLISRLSIKEIRLQGTDTRATLLESNPF